MTGGYRGEEKRVHEEGVADGWMRRGRWWRWGPKEEEDGEGTGEVDARWHAPVHCRHIRLEVMAFFSTRLRRGCVPDRILTGETNSISGWPAANYACKARDTLRAIYLRREVN